MTPHISVLSSRASLSLNTLDITADGSSLPVTYHDSLNSITDPSSRFYVPYILHVPKLSLNIFFVSQLNDRNCTISFTSSACFVHDRHEGELISHGHWLHELYYKY